MSEVGTADRICADTLMIDAGHLTQTIGMQVVEIYTSSHHMQDCRRKISTSRALYASEYCIHRLDAAWVLQGQHRPYRAVSHQKDTLDKCESVAITICSSHCLTLAQLSPRKSRALNHLRGHCTRTCSDACKSHLTRQLNLLLQEHLVPRPPLPASDASMQRRLLKERTPR